MSIRITGSGSYIPPHSVPNTDFADHQFLQDDGQEYPYSQEQITEKFKSITGIEDRRYVDKDLTASDIGAIAAKRALEDSGCNPEELDYIIVSHNFGDRKSVV